MKHIVFKFLFIILLVLAGKYFLVKHDKVKVKTTKDLTSYEDLIEEHQNLTKQEADLVKLKYTVSNQYVSRRKDSIVAEKQLIEDKLDSILKEINKKYITP